ncbi:hypothetical protein A2661_02430 [Candidatus Giovannonibacteria bacterium RIFCSPHIGHO2_01_FULL_45_24]|uniref:Glycosyltransferase RgtA/B/C/D-like domain-containing protein n=1 Tax=Candidatus Giovannonibacteria bacterium RIFCSPLOWO2_01_FULL_46_32 TaxID=1798353 RepID=A0A1F5XG61_9BACT|nr:MAG: hypothetical protein A2661_02430 [Candidatus Giovannonibacteria bacterium RIFCSPHIGHO2_01_FULL_45_24]OGF86859.1 MAG: hypothetical protein A3B19_02200 [Candidatus Giovannonibacteria bacterium RIFCSPLOWO2_01_FULL_46_32]
MKNRWGLVVLILLLAAFFRFWDLKNAPPGLWADEAVNGVNALRAIETNGWKVFYPENFGREGLFINIQSVFIKSFGAETWVLRLPSAIFGVLTVLGLYLMTRELFGRRVALFASFFLATSFWHINFSRIGFRAIMAPFFFVWSFYFLFLGARKLKQSLFILAGLLFGLGFHSYIAYRIAPLIAVLPLWRFYTGRKNQEAGLQLGSPASKFCPPCLIGLFIFATFLAALPLLWYYVQNPQDFLGRTAAISIFDAPNPLGQFSENLIKTLGMFNVAGDFNWRHNLAGSPQFWWPVGLLFLLGLWLSIKAILKPTPERDSESLSSPSPMEGVGGRVPSFPLKFTLLWFIVMLLPVALSNESLPHALRAIVLIPSAMIFAALGLEWIIQKFNEWLDKQKTNYPEKIAQLNRVAKEATLLLFVFFIAAAAHTYNTYFIRWAPNSNVYQAFQTNLTEKTNWLNAQPKEIKKYVVTDATERVDMRGTPMSFQPIIFITNTFFESRQKEKNIYYFGVGGFDSIDCSSWCIIIPVESKPTIYKTLKQKIPSLRLDTTPGFVVLKNY